MSESKPTLRREQIAGMNIHYIMVVARLLP